MTVLYLDEDVRHGTASRLRTLGYATFTTQQLGRDGAEDPDQVLYAAQRGWTLVTHNRRDYQVLHLAWLLWSMEPNHAGILALDKGPSSAAVVAAIDALLSASPTLTDILYNWTLRDDTWRAYVP